MKNFTSISNLIIRDKDLPNALFRTYVALRSYGYGNNPVFPSQKTVAKDLGKSRETINKHCAELEKIGYIRFKKRGYSMSNVYEFICEKKFTNDKQKVDETVSSSVRNTSYELLDSLHPKKTSNKTINKTFKDETNDKGYEKLKNVADSMRKPK